MLTAEQAESNISTTIKKRNYKIITKIAAHAKDTAICEKTTLKYKSNT